MNFLVFLSALVACAAGVPADATVPKREGRAVGGGKTFSDQFPYVASLRLNDEHVCGAVIVGENTALATMECVNGDGNITVVAGTLHRNGSGIPNSVTQIIRSPYYNPSFLLDNDIAILKLRDSFEFNKTVRSIKLTNSVAKIGSFALFAGWGNTHRTIYTPAETLRMMHMVIAGKEICKDKLNTSHRKYICAYSFLTNGNGPSTGDEGAPLIFEGELAGIMSSFKEVNGKNYSVFLDINFYADWIKKYI